MKHTSKYISDYLGSIKYDKMVHKLEHTQQEKIRITLGFIYPVPSQLLRPYNPKQIMKWLVSLGDKPDLVYSHKQGYELSFYLWSTRRGLTNVLNKENPEINDVYCIRRSSTYYQLVTPTWTVLLNLSKQCFKAENHKHRLGTEDSENLVLL